MNISKSVALSVLCVVVAVVGLAQGQMVARESFDYSRGSVDGRNEGAGFAGRWDGAGRVVEDSLVFPDGIEKQVSGGKLEISGGTVFRAINWDGLCLAKSDTHYISMLINKGGSKAASGENLTVWIRPEEATLGGFEIMSDEKFKLNQRAGNIISEEVSAPYVTYWVLLKIVTRQSGMDDYYLTWFAEGEVVPKDETDISWKLTQSINNSYRYPASKLDISAGASIKAYVDEIYVGKSYQDLIISK